VNYDLPWNPMKVEQRIGRIDRIGQTAERSIFFNLVLCRYDRLTESCSAYERLNLFEKALRKPGSVLGEEIQQFDC